jgi:hypothetical protein
MEQRDRFLSLKILPQLGLTLHLEIQSFTQVDARAHPELLI